MGGDSWTAERLDLLRRLWAEGQTAAAIAVCLGSMSRSAVLGKIFRCVSPLLGLLRPLRNNKAMQRRIRTQAVRTLRAGAAARSGRSNSSRPSMPPSAARGCSN